MLNDSIECFHEAATNITQFLWVTLYYNNHLQMATYFNRQLNALWTSFLKMVIIKDDPVFGEIIRTGLYRMHEQKNPALFSSDFC